MSFWKKIFGKTNENSNNKTESHFDKYRRELNELNLKSTSDLENLVKPLIRQATKLEISPASRPPENSQMNSHFGGNPYFEKGEKWPVTKKGKSLDFIFQVFNKPESQLPDNIELIQFYYDWDEFPWDTSDDGWLVKVYKKIDPKNTEFIVKPIDLEKPKYCEIIFEPSNSLPDWEGISEYDYNAQKLSCILNEDQPWDNYGKIVEKLVGEQNYQSQLGGYPKWIQGESTPKDKNGNNMKLLFQIDSEENANLMWGDSGLIYVFYDHESERIDFNLQCY
ncbi:DUF1963 domain-containing protein [Aquimarina sp. AD1]|uniref:DUF1963 domain-containing protein n=1 Tax=Aquimarina sp. (strain AD1) TaxID=1714848 RepID=UPI000E4A2317|nr:YwqG family protein [Aquimarina sp. AD1]AXT54652.1 DUF1963 domain-containing protein [Aquimarina sp. AD1]RKN21719.1 DUF1963 domain-containing protein [Aquimarina sp. AD1]